MRWKITVVSFLAAGCSSGALPSAPEEAPTPVLSIQSAAAATASTGTSSLSAAVLFPPRTGDIDRPPLSGDPMALTAQELVQAGYPPRPDPNKNPDEYANWLTFVSKPERQIMPAVAISNHTATIAEQKQNYSGYYVDSPWTCYGVTCGYVETYAYWNVPSLAGSPAKPAASSAWIGLDGFGTYGAGHIVQAGTEHDENAGDPNCGSSYVWYEYVPFDSTQRCYPNTPTNHPFPIHPNDQMVVAIFIGDANGSTDLSGQFFWYYISDATTGVGTGWAARQYPQSPTVFIGATGDWIVERTLRGGSLPWLADFGQIQMNNPIVWDMYGEIDEPINARSGIVYNDTMVNPVTYNQLASAQLSGANVLVTWKNWY